MSRVPLPHNNQLRIAALSASTLSLGLSLLLASPVQAQSVDGLRSARIDDRSAQDTRVAASSAVSRDAVTTQSNQYVPVSEGPTDKANPSNAEGEDRSLFDNSDAGAAELDQRPAPRQRPSTAREREDVRKDRRDATSRTAVEDASAEPDAEDEDAAVADREAELTAGTVRVPTADATDDLPLDEGSERAAAIEGLETVPEENPFAAPGIRVGTFIIRPSLEQGITATSNADSSVDGDSAVLSETTLRLNALSDWSRHTASLDAYGLFRRSLSGEELEETEAGVDARLELDLGEELRGIVTAQYARRPDSASSAVVIEDTVSQPLLQSYGVSAAIEKDMGKLRFALTGRLGNDDYGDAELSSGGILSQEDRNSTLATVSIRGGYEISPAITPFVELELGKREYDQEIDFSGYSRSSDRLGVRGGVALDFNEKLNGELSGGWIRESFDDDRLTDISGASLNADLRWSLQRGTVLALAASTIVEGTTTPGESGSLLHQGAITIDREIRANLTANAAVGAGYRDFTGSDGHDKLWRAELGATWWLNRYAGLTGRLRYESLESNLPGRDYDEKSAFLGLKVQR